MKSINNEIVRGIRADLGLDKHDGLVSESYVTTAKKYELRTELLSEKTKKSHQELLENYVETLNSVSAELDTTPKDEANLNNSDFRSLKIDEVYNLNAAYLHALYFENISDVNSRITMDSLAYMRLQRDFGSFDDWQKDFIACAMSARNGWAITVFNAVLNRYINVVVDLHSEHVPIASYPVVVLDVWEHAYYRDYLKDRKSYVFAMMKELNWDTIEERFKKCDRIAKVIK
jgi:Fe-Mn family superoxide dismutase